jgi:hypothetical protein
MFGIMRTFGLSFESWERIGHRVTCLQGVKRTKRFQIIEQLA